MLTSTWLSDWLTLRRAELRPRTIESYEDLIRRYILPAIGEREITEVSAADLRHLLASIMATGKSRTAELVYVLLKCAFSDLDLNPMQKVKRPKHRQQSPQPWTDDQMVTYLTACRSHRHGLALSLGLLLGLRRGEICGLRWGDIDVTVGVIHITNQRITLATGETIDAPPKSDAGVRDIPIPPQLLPLLRSSRGLPSAYLCTLKPSGLDQAHAKLVKSLSLPHIPLHGLRHTMATSSLRHGGDMRSLQYLLGHASYTTTANVYTHPDDGMIKTSIDAAIRPCYNVLQAK